MFMEAELHEAESLKIALNVNKRRLFVFLKTTNLYPFFLVVYQCYAKRYEMKSNENKSFGPDLASFVM